MESTNFEWVSLYEKVQLDLTVWDLENIFFAMGHCSIPLLSENGNKGYVATFNAIYNQATRQLGLEMSEWSEIIAKKKHVNTVVDNLDISNIAEEVTQKQKDAKRAKSK